MTVLEPADLGQKQTLSLGDSQAQKLAVLRAVDKLDRLGAEGVRRDDRYAADGDVSEYRDLVRQGVTVIATDTPLAVKSVLGAEVAKAATCARPR